MTTKWLHFVAGWWLLKQNTEQQGNSEVDNPKKEFHLALLAILDKREITQENIWVLEENQWIVLLQSILDWVETDKRQTDSQASEKHIKRHVNNVKSRIIQSLNELELWYTFTQAKTISSEMLWDTREININSIMIGDLRNKLILK